MADLKKTGMVFDIQSLSLHDGPGIRTLVFLKGCPLNCLWCANPEGQNTLTEIRYHSSNCIGCLKCAKACIKKAISIKSGNAINKKEFIIIDRTKCSDCTELKCVDACFNDALKITGEKMSVERIMKVVKRDMPYYRGNGGVTLSGGDPTYQPEFAVEILRACQEEYINTAIESAMFVNSHIVDQFIPYTDLFLTDIKHIDTNIHKKLTGVYNDVIISNIVKLAKAKPVVIRIPIIPTLNDDDKNISGIAEFCKENNITRINILPYHKLGQIKYEQLGRGYEIPDLQSSDNKMEHLKQIVEKVGIKCIVG